MLDAIADSSSPESPTMADSVMHDINAIPALPQVLDLIGVSDVLKLAGTVEAVAKSFPECAASAKAAVCAGIVAIGKFFAGDTKGAKAELAKVATAEGKNLAKIGALLGAAAMVGVNFIPLGKVAGAATRSLGKSLGGNVCKKLVTDKFEKSIANAAGNALEAALKQGEKDIEKLVAVQIKAVSAKVEKQVAKMVEDDVYKILMTLSSKTSTKTSVRNALISCGISNSKKEAQNLAEELIKANVRGAFKSATAKREMKAILIESMTKSFNEAFEAGIKEGKYGKVFKAEIEERCKKFAQKGLIDSNLEKQLVSRADEVFEKGVKEGAEKGIIKGVEKAFRRFEKDRHIQSLREYLRRSNKGTFEANSVHGETVGDVMMGKVDRTYANLTNTWNEPDWKERLRREMAKGKAPSQAGVPPIPVPISNTGGKTTP